MTVWLSQDGRREYLVAWRGWDDAQSSWEPCANLYVASKTRDDERLTLMHRKKAQGALKEFRSRLKKIDREEGKEKADEGGK